MKRYLLDERGDYMISNGNIIIDRLIRTIPDCSAADRTLKALCSY